jgi:hypothetical protein
MHSHLETVQDCGEERRLWDSKDSIKKNIDKNILKFKEI